MPGHGAEVDVFEKIWVLRKLLIVLNGIAQKCSKTTKMIICGVLEPDIFFASQTLDILAFFQL